MLFDLIIDTLIALLPDGFKNKDGDLSYAGIIKICIIVCCVILSIVAIVLLITS